LATKFVSNFHYAIMARDQVADRKVRDLVADLDANPYELVADLAGFAIRSATGSRTNGSRR